MKKINWKKVFWGTVFAGGIVAGPCLYRLIKDANRDAASSELITSDPYGNVALFEKNRSKIKFALSFVENYYPYVYWCGEAWTTGDGLTVLYDDNGKKTFVTPNTPIPTMDESDVYKGRYMTFEILPDIANLVRVPMDEKTLIAACVLRYCIGHKNFKKSAFLRQLNAGKKGAELAKTLTGWRQQEGVPKRCYFFAAIMANKMDFSELLNLRAEGCYLLDWRDIFVYSDRGLKIDRNGFCEWDFSKLPNNLQKAKGPKVTLLNLGRARGKIRVACKLTKDIVPDYILQEVLAEAKTPNILIPEIVCPNDSADSQNDISYIAYQQGDYATAMESAKKALKLATTNKQRGAACYNLGMACLATGKYADAITYLEQSLAYNQTKAAKDALEEARQKNSTNNQGLLKVVCAGAVGYAGWRYARRRYMGKPSKTR